MAIIAIDHLQVACPPHSEKQVREYWGDLLGLTEVKLPEAIAHKGGCWFRVGAIGLHVGVQDDFVPATVAHPSLRVDTLEELASLSGSLMEAGYPVEWAQIPIASARFKTKDPFGNLVELLVGTTG